MKTPTAFGYVRVSTASQADNGVSLDAQQEKIKAWCLANEYNLASCYSDAGLSGSRADNRPALQDALQAVCKVRGSALIVYSLSRLARSTKDAIGIAERLDRAGADMVSLSERIDTTSAAGRMVFRMLAVLSEFERDLVSERTKAAMQHLRANGKRVSGRIPYGFDLDADGRTLTLNNAEQAVIADIRNMRAGGKKLREIADALNDRGIATKMGAKVWSIQTLSQILKRAR